jgi:hypothetical protein
LEARPCAKARDRLSLQAIPQRWAKTLDPFADAQAIIDEHDYFPH